MTEPATSYTCTSVPILVLLPILLTEVLRVLVPTLILLMDVGAFSVLSLDYGLRARGKCIQISGHSATGNLKSIFHLSYASTASLASHAHCGCREITSGTLAAVIRDEEESCSVNTANCPESSFSASPRNTTRPCTFGICCPILNLWHKSIRVARRSVLPLFFASSVATFLFLRLESCQASVLFCKKLSRTFSTCTFASDIVHCFGEEKADEPNWRDSKIFLHGLQCVFRAFVCSIQSCDILEKRKHQVCEHNQYLNCLLLWHEVLCSCVSAHGLSGWLRSNY